MFRNDPPATAALTALCLLQAIMLFALFTGTPPHPPVAVTPFAMGPFLGASLAVAVAALILGPVEIVWGRALALLAGAAALISFGPQKYVDPAFPQIWPAVLTAQAAIVTLVLRVIAAFRQPRASLQDG